MPFRAAAPTGVARADAAAAPSPVTAADVKRLARRAPVRVTDSPGVLGGGPGSFISRPPERGVPPVAWREAFQGEIVSDERSLE